MEGFEEVAEHGGEAGNELFPGSIAGNFGVVLQQYNPEVSEGAVKIAGRQGNLVAGDVISLNGVAKTFVFCKTVTGALCGGFMRPAWSQLNYAADPTHTSFLFALANSQLTVPARFGFVGGADDYIGFLAEAFVCFTSSPGYALFVGHEGVMSGGGGKWEAVPGGISTIVGLSGTAKDLVEIAEWEVWKL
jgi:hypothetical protein